MGLTLFFISTYYIHTEQFIIIIMRSVVDTKQSALCGPPAEHHSCTTPVVSSTVRIAGKPIVVQSRDPAVSTRLLL